ncbi:MAG: OmpA family protein [Chitinophagaceae bacterium]|nr:OmpA family protein [Chitinophagaceae bacterium]
MKKLLLLLFLFAGPIAAMSQVKVGLFGGANRSTIVQTSDQANWSTIKPNYDPIYGYHGGLLAEFALNKKGSLAFQPNVAYYNKGRKYFETFAAGSLLQDSGVKQMLNYIDIPLNIIGKIRIAKNFKFIIGAGPYASFFLSGKEKTTTTDPSGTVITRTNADLPVGNGPGKYKTFDYGINVLAGFEIGKLFLRAEASQSLGDMYQGNGFKGTFKNQVIGVSLGYNFDIKSAEPAKKKLPDTAATKKPAEVKDKDGDGIADADDDCPKDAGTAATKGCPDKDGDGVADKDDKCPDVKGLIGNKGCPAPDADGDGVPDSEDKCPNEKGTILTDGCPARNEVTVPVPVKGGDRDGDGIKDENDQCPDEKGFLRYNGCPIPDSDGDGINDEIDKCKTEAGAREKIGCPLVTKQKNKKDRPAISNEVVETVAEKANRIQFSQSEIELNAAAQGALDEVVELMNSNPELNMSIEGHASLEGDHYVNLALSNGRANSVRNYLVSKGISKDRLSTSWYGTDRLITRDPKKQSQNRRVELKPY